jgi:hypothetical protein
LAHVHDPGWLLTALSGGPDWAQIPQHSFSHTCKTAASICGLQKLLQQARLARSSVSRDGFSSRPKAQRPAVIKAAAVGMAPAKRAAVQNSMSPEGFGIQFARIFLWIIFLIKIGAALNRRFQ